jgi:hypothetical protein
MGSRLSAADQLQRYAQEGRMFFARLLVDFSAACMPVLAIASGAASQGAGPVARSGVTGLWILANISYAGMRAQNSSSAGWRVVAFIFGFPGTFISYLAVAEGGERAYGVQLPRNRPPDGWA